MVGMSIPNKSPITTLQTSADGVEDIRSEAASVATIDEIAAHGLIVGRVGEPRKVDADIVIPVYNEQEQLASSTFALMNHLTASQAEGYAFTWQIVIADNASTDRTWDIAIRLAGQYPDRVRAVRIARKGRGRALKLTWGESRARTVAYMDVDLSTDIRLTGVLIGSLLYGGADISFGCRLFDESDVTRCAKREFISRTYNGILRTALGAGFHDAQCGFKAMTVPAARHLLPYIQDDEWFFDTEMLLLAQATNMRMYEFPVRWIEDPGSTVNIPDTVVKDLRGMWRMRGTLAAIRRQAAKARLADPVQDQGNAGSCAGSSNRRNEIAASARPKATPSAA